MHGTLASQGTTNFRRAGLFRSGVCVLVGPVVIRARAIRSARFGKLSPNTWHFTFIPDPQRQQVRRVKSLLLESALEADLTGDVVHECADHRAS